MRRTFGFLHVAGALAALLLCVIFTFPAAAGELLLHSLKITAPDGRVRDFRVEVAASASSRATGLMNRKSLAEGRGMIFIFPQPKEIMMWMKDTLIPLDMLFIDTSGRVIRIAENVKPMDETIIPSRGLSAYVLEIAGGEAKRLNLSPGDTVSGPAIEFKAAD